MVLLTGQSLSPITYFLLGNILLPWFLFVWILAFTDFLNIKRKEIFVLLFLIFGLLYDGLLIYYTLTNPNNIGKLTSPVDVEYKGIFSLLLLMIIFIVCITGLLFAKESFKSQQKESKLRGRFIALAFISWTIGAIADSAFTLNFITLPIIRILLISSSVEFYIGIVMPERIRNLFISEILDEIIS